MARKSKLISKIIPLVSLSGLLFSCSSIKLIEKRYFAFDTTLLLTYDGEEEFGDTLVSPLNSLSDLCDTYKEVPGVINAYSINNASDFLTVEKDLFDVLSLADDYYQDTNGVFNPLIKDISELWKASLKEDKLPDQTTLNSLLEKLESASLEFNGLDKVRINGDARIDLGAIAKGYALSKVKRAIANTEITNYIFNAGYSSILLGENSENNGLYRVGMNNTSGLYLELKKTSIGTSSIYEQKSLTIDGKTYSHIVDGTTGSTEVKHHMVIVVSDDPVLSDVYSTVGMVSSIEKIQQIERETGSKFITLTNGEVTYHNPDIEVHKR